jgi:hypothetical protein
MRRQNELFLVGIDEKLKKTLFIKNLNLYLAFPRENPTKALC